jgi:uncharacterized repeat protein (TIGR02543 family)
MKKTLVLLFFLSFIFTLSARTVLASQTYSVEVESFLDDSNRNINVPAITGKARGEKVSFSASGIGEQYSFAFYAVNNIVRDDLPSDYQFTVRSNMKITSIYHPNGSLNPLDQRFVVVFADSNGFILSIKYVEAGTTVSDLDVTLPDKPNAVVASPKWSTADGLTTSLENINSNRVYFLQYEVDSEVTSVTLTANNATGSGTYGFNEVATVVAQNDLEGVPFSHFEDAEGNLLSTKQTYKFTMVADTTVNAIYASTPEFSAPLVNMTDTLNIRSGHTSYIGQFELASGYELVEYGFIISRSSDVLTLESLGATVIPSNVHNGQTGEFLRSFTTDSYNSIRAYLIVSNTNGETPVQEVYYSENYTRNPESLGSAGAYYTGFETASKGSYTTGNITENGVEWTLNDALIGADANSIDTKSVRTRGSIYTLSGFSGISTITFKAAIYGTDTVNSVILSLSNDGVTWVDVSDGLSSTSISSSSLVDYTFTLSNSSNFPVSNLSASELLRVKLTVGVLGQRVNIDEININYSAFNGPIHEVKYNVDGVLSEEMLANGAQVSLSPTKSNHTFDGWYLDNNFLTPHNNAQITQSLTLYAKFTINSYTVTFNYNGADGGDLTPSITASSGSNINLPIPTKTGYDFAGWESSTGATQYTSPFTIGTTNNNMYAKWTINDLGRTMEDAAALSLPTTINEATTLTLPLSGSNGSTISWATSNSSIITTGGVVTLPTGTTVVTLSATISLNGENTERLIEINVIGAGTSNYATDLIISEYIESGSHKAIELYNGTGADIDLSNYSIKTRVNTTYSWSNITISGLSGILSHGSTFVITNTSTTFTVTRVTASLQFNGDDAIGLFKGNDLLDIFGVFNPDPGSYWTVPGGKTEDNSIIRISSAINPSTIWDINEWLATSYTSGNADLGQHISNASNP